jgi:putative tryptophan/tyrosine transport system substrate-binding protein
MNAGNTRRAFVALGGLASSALVRSALAQAAVKRLAFIGPASAAGFLSEVTRRLEQRGWKAREQIDIIHWRTPLSDEQSQAMRDALASGGYSVVVSNVMGIAMRLREIAPHLPLVVDAMSDPVAAGLAQSLALPGGNVTGFHAQSDEMAAQRIALLREFAPAMRTLAVPHARGIPPEIIAELAAQIERYANVAGLRARLVPYQSLDELQLYLAPFAGREGGLYLVADTLSTNAANAKRIAEMAAAMRIASVGEAPAFARLGGLMAYNASADEMLDALAL